MRSLLFALALTGLLVSHAEAASGNRSAVKSEERVRGRKAALGKKRISSPRSRKGELHRVLPSASPSVTKAGRVITVRRPLGRRSELITPGSLRAAVLDAAKWGISLTRWEVSITGANTIELRAQMKPGLFSSGTPRAIRASVFTPIQATVQRAAGEELVTFVLPYDL
jgi:hypothetical protein